MRSHAYVTKPDSYPRFRCRGCGFRTNQRSLMVHHIKACAIEELNPIRLMKLENQA
jgi:hypothetical protein